VHRSARAACTSSSSRDPPDLVVAVSASRAGQFDDALRPGASAAVASSSPSTSPSPCRSRVIRFRACFRCVSPPPPSPPPPRLIFIHTAGAVYYCTPEVFADLIKFLRAPLLACLLAVAAAAAAAAAAGECAANLRVHAHVPVSYRIGSVRMIPERGRSNVDR